MPRYHKPNGQYKYLFWSKYQKTRKSEENITTLTAADSIGDLNVPNPGVSTVLKDRRPLALARILNPLSAVVTARRFPSLLNLKCERVWIDSYNYIRNVL